MKTNKFTNRVLCTTISINIIIILVEGNIHTYHQQKKNKINNTIVYNIYGCINNHNIFGYAIKLLFVETHTILQIHK